MDRELSPERDLAEPIPIALPDLDRLPSRRAGRDAIRTALNAGRGLVVLTGGPGVGKTLLRRSLEAESSPPTRWLGIEIAPSTTARGLYSLIRHGSGLGPGAFDRTALLSFLSERSHEGEQWILVIDEAHNLADEHLEEIRVLSNRLGDTQGFASIFLIGQSALAHRLSLRSASAIASRIAAHVHLRPLDADEIGQMLKAFDPSREWPVGLIDRIHLLSEGRPGHVSDLATRMIPRPQLLNPVSPPSPHPTIVSSTDNENSNETEPATFHPEPLVGPSKPPIRVEEGLIEVGWQAESEYEEAPGLTTTHLGNPRLETTIEGEERINDHYAALQAWQEWATNQGRLTEISGTIQTQKSAKAVVPQGLDESSPLSATTNLWADEEHGFAPLGRLFTRLKQENETE